MNAKVEDYVVQGDSVYWLATGIKANPKAGTCSCDSDFTCKHLQQARLVMAIGDSMDDLAKALRGTTIDADELPPLTGEQGARLLSIVNKCDRCKKWRCVDDMSEDVDGVCIDCIR